MNNAGQWWLHSIKVIAFLHFHELIFFLLYMYVFIPVILLTTGKIVVSLARAVEGTANLSIAYSWFVDNWTL